jgi:hypothetical protein
MQPSTHENFAREEAVTSGSDRSFGLVMATVLLLLAALNGWHHGRSWPWTGSAGVLLLGAALLYPSVLAPLNRVWFKFGLLLHKVVNPIIMALMFYGAVLPTGLVMRALGHDLLRQKRDPGADSYWIRREPPGPAPESMIDQF